MHHQGSKSTMHHDSASSKASRDGGSAVSTACCLRLFRLGAPLCNGSMHAPPFEQDHPSSRGHVRLPELIAIDNGILAAQ